MIKIKVLLVVVIFSFVGCKDSPEQNSKTISSGKEKNISKKQVITISPAINCGQDFTSFFRKFSSDSIFQSSRIKFPLKMISFDIFGSDQTTPIEEFTSVQEYSFFDFSEDEKAKNRDIDAYSTTIERKDKDEYSYRMLGIDNGIMVEFLFQKQNNCWFLVSIKDQST